MDNNTSGELVKNEKKTKSNAQNLKVLIVAAIFVLASLAAAGYFYMEAQNANDETPSAQVTKNDEESARVIAALKEVLYIDQTDNPTVARVDNADELRKANEDFYKNAQNGDFLILYPQRAVLFREDGKQIINVAPIINTGNLKQANQSPSELKTGASEQAPDTEQ